MGGVNKVILLGQVGQDPELRYSQGGGAIMNLRVATTEKFEVNGQKKEETQWHSCVMFGKRAEALGRIITKGYQVYIEGSIRYRTWEDKQGQKRYQTEVIVQNVELLGSGKGGGRQQNLQRSHEPDPFGPETHVGGNDGTDDLIPF